MKITSGGRWAATWTPTTSRFITEKSGTINYDDNNSRDSPELSPLAARGLSACVCGGRSNFVFFFGFLEQLWQEKGQEHLRREICIAGGGAAHRKKSRPPGQSRSRFSNASQQCVLSQAHSTRIMTPTHETCIHNGKKKKKTAWGAGSGERGGLAQLRQPEPTLGVKEAIAGGRAATKQRGRITIKKKNVGPCEGLTDGYCELNVVTTVPHGRVRPESEVVNPSWA